jgi:hypothetical protein
LTIRPLGLLAIFLISACGYRSELPATRSLQPGDRDYPQVNPSPTQIVQFTATVPEGLSAEFHLVYGVALPQDGSNLSMTPGCRWSQAAQFYVDVPLQLAKSASGYRGSFAPDYFRSGPCGWHLADIISPMLTTWIPSDTSGPVVFFNHSEHANSHPLPSLDLSTKRIDIWCTRKHMEPPTGTPKENTRIRCVPLAFVNDLPNAFADSIPPNNREWDVHATQYLQSLTVEFHDVDDLMAAYIEAHK